MKVMKYNRYAVILATMLSLLMVACGTSPEKQKAQRKASAEKLRAEEQAAFKIGVTPTLDCLPLYLMKDSALYDTAKVDVRLKPFAAHMDIDTALVGGSIQAAATELVRAVELHRTHGTSLRPMAVTPLQWTLVGDKKNKVTTLPSLANKMIAMTRFSATDWLTTLTRRRMKGDSIVFSVQINDIQLRCRMIMDDEMDAAWLPEPQAAMALGRGNVALASSDKEGRQFGIIVFREPGDATADKREAERREVEQAYNRAVDLINSRGLRYYAALIKKYMNADDRAIARLPKLRFEHAGGPSRSDMIAAEKIRFRKHTARVKIQ